ncbi:MAG: 2-oxoacid:acceptor oxidoreductase subunit alpha [Phycisphaeraceae bacterium]
MIASRKQVERIPSATVRFAGDSGDGMQLAGMRFTDASAIFGNDVATLPDFPAEIRAPIGTVAGVSGFQINFASSDIRTPGDQVDALIAMNPAAFRANIADVRSGGIVIVNETEFDKINLRKAGYQEGYNPIHDEVLTARYRIVPVPMTRLNEEVLKDTGMGAKDIGRSRNMYALGLIYWLFDREMQPTIDFLNDFFGKKKKLPQVAEANIKVLQAGWNFGETAELFVHRYQVARADDIPPGKYRRITGNEATAIGLVTASKLCGKDVVYCSYPITPASDVLHYLAAMKQYGVKTVQAEDEIAAACAAIGASFAGQLGITGTSGPGLCLKSEAINLAIMTELPMVIVNVQRGGPSTGLPTKTEQSDLLQALFGRNGDSPLVVLAPQSPSDCFDMAIEAVKIAVTHMVPVILLSDGYIANGAEPWRIPDPRKLETFEIQHPAGHPRGKDDPAFRPYERDERLVRPWAIPGTEGLEHRIGGLEKENGSGTVAYGDENHQLMTDLRKRKVELVADDIPPLTTEGPDTGDLLLLGWGGTYGAITTAANNMRAKGHKVSAAHLRYMNPMPKNLGDVLRKFKQVLIPELNTGQLSLLIRAKYLIDAKGLNKVAGKPFLVNEIEQAIGMMLDGQFTAQSATPRQHVVEMNV